MKTLLRKIPDPLLRIVVVLAVLAGVVLTLRSLLPPSLKDHDLQVQATVEREIARPVRHAGSDACAECHDQFNVKKAGYHRNLSC
jgi:cytochrome c553